MGSVEILDKPQRKRTAEHKNAYPLTFLFCQRIKFLPTDEIYIITEFLMYVVLYGHI
jgi:hypothetical protein